MFLGSHLLDSYCGQHQNIALSSGEAELHEVVNGTAHGLFLKHVLEEMGSQGITVKVGTDSAAALGISHRLGVRSGPTPRREATLDPREGQVRRGEAHQDQDDGQQGRPHDKASGSRAPLGLGQLTPAIGANGSKRSQYSDSRYVVGSLT